MELREPSSDHPLPVVPDRPWPPAPTPDPSAGLDGPAVRAPITTRRAVALVAAGVPVVMLVTVGIVWLTSPAHVADWQCEGIGFGCTLAPRDLVFLFGVFVGVPACVVLSVVFGLVAWLVRPEWKRGVVGTLLGLEGVMFLIVTSMVAGMTG